MKIDKTVTADIRIIFDENSEEFKELLKEYRECIDANGDYDSIASTIASNMARYGTTGMIEGIGTRRGQQTS